MRTIAAFDFDGTLTYSDSLPPFLGFVRGYGQFALDLTMCLPLFIQYGLGKKSRQEVKEKLVERCLKPSTYKVCQEWGVEFAETKIHGLLRPGALERIAYHQKLGHEVVLISANLGLYLIPWGKKQGFEKVICSEIAEVNGNLTGYLVGNNCWGKEKVRRLEAWAGERDKYVLWAYGDSEGDKELLAFADHPFYRSLTTEGKQT